MKKILAILLTFSLLMTAVAALAEDNASTQNQMPTTNGPGPFPGGGRPEDMPEPPNGEKPDAAPEKPAGEQPEDAPEAPNGEKPDAAPEKPTGEKPEDAPAEPEDSQANGEKPNAAPVSPDGGNANNRKPGGRPAGQIPEGQAPEMPDWDKLVTDGVISEETAAKLKAYIEENLPENLQEKPDGEKPADPPQTPEDGKPADPQGKPEGEEPANPNLEIVNQLLEAGVLTQEEADAVSAWITENTPMDPAAETSETL